MSELSIQLMGVTRQ